MKEFFEKNRKKLLDKLNDGDLVILYAGAAPVKRGDENYPFTPDRNFYYVTGIDRQNLIFAIGKLGGKDFERLYIEPDNGQMARWIGANLTAEEAEEISGVKDIKLTDNFEDDLQLLSKDTKKLYLDLDRKDLDIESIKEGMSEVFKAVKIENIFNTFAQMRVIKEPWEIELVRKAGDITRLGIEEMMKNAKPGMWEYEIEAYYDFVLRKNGVKDKAFSTIAASGMNGTTLHYVENNSKTHENDLILIDAGAQWEYYAGDISRTFPVSGKFTERQKLVYNIVLGGQQLVIDNIKPGVEYPSLNEMLKEYYFEELKKIGLVKTKEEVFNYYFHGVSHFIGAETHDVGDRSQTLKPGMIISVEPGLYIAEWSIGIRIEDDALVTENGCEILTKDMIKTVDDIERFMAEGKKNV